MLEGRLVRLRAPEPDDKERAYQWINDPEVTRFLMARYPISRVEEENWLNHNAATPQGFLSEVRLAIVAKDSDAHIGFTGLHKISPEDRHADLGIMIGDRSYWERGYGTDAMITLVRHAFDGMNLNKVKLGVFDINARAQAVYRKVGFVEDGRLRQEYYQEGRYWDVIQMSILRDEFYALHRVTGAQTASA